MAWGETRAARGVREQDFQLTVAGRPVPGAFWTPDGKERGNALVLLGHGGGTSKRAPYLLAIARWLVRNHGISAFAIDGPGHGGRIPPGTEPDFRNAWNDPATTDHVIADWHGALDFIRNETAGDAPLAWWGLSMGTMMGLPVVAATPGMKAALLGLMGVWGPNAERLQADAPRLACPVRFLVQWDDEVVPRDAACELFTLIGSEHKTLHGNPGLHQAVPPHEMRGSVDFLAKRLKA